MLPLILLALPLQPTCAIFSGIGVVGAQAQRRIGKGLVADWIADFIRLLSHSHCPIWPASDITQRRRDIGRGSQRGQATDSQGHTYHMADTSQLEAKMARKQREKARKQKGFIRHRRVTGQRQKCHRKQKRIRSNDTHHVSLELVDRAHTIVLKDLNTAGLTQSAKKAGIVGP